MEPILPEAVRMTMAMSVDHLQRLLQPRLPAGTIDHVLGLVAGRPLEVRLVPPRRTKLGDYRAPREGRTRVSVVRGWWSGAVAPWPGVGGTTNGGIHRITLNDDLNPFALLTTLLHEIAHLVTHERRVASGRRRRQRPHGPEWKASFGDILSPLVQGGRLPDDVAEAIGTFLADPPAATCTDRRLTAVLRRYDPPRPGVESLEGLPESALFRLVGGRAFRRGRRLRTTFHCVELTTGRPYRVRSDALVMRIDAPGPVGVGLAEGRRRRTCASQSVRGGSR